MKNVEQWCFSIGKNGERLLVMVFQQRGEENEKLLVVVFQQQEGKSETGAGRSCFGNENDEEMADWNVLGVGRIEKVLNSGVSASGRKSASAAHSSVSAS
jgi:hypothetical protein